MNDISTNQAYLFNTGTDCMSYHMLGSHPLSLEEQEGYRFAVWAPEAVSVSIVGDFNEWNPEVNTLSRMKDTGIFTGKAANAKKWDRYKYCIITKDNTTLFKTDPFGFHFETRPKTASIVYPLEDGYIWQDANYMEKRQKDGNCTKYPMNIYEMHLGSWKRNQDGSVINYRELAVLLAGYLVEAGYTHVELMPVMEHPLDDSWGYQTTGYYAPTSRFGTPDDFKYFVDYLHGHNIKVILDWVPAHFPKDLFALSRFDGSALYEYADDRIGEHKEWGTLVFNYSRSEVRSFMISNAVFWLDQYHIDGLRVDAVSSMLYLNYCRLNYKKNINGGIENLEAIVFLKQLNETIRSRFPEVVVIAEEATAWPNVTLPVSEGGLGFTHKWNMGWMHDTLEYFSRDFIYRKWHHSQLTFSMMYSFTENFVLPVSHDEVVHGKKSLLDKMPGDYWRKFASLRVFHAYMMAHPGGKLHFMGSEFGQFIEWRFFEPLEWFLLEYEQHAMLFEYVKKVNHIYLNESSLWIDDKSWNGFSWHHADDIENSIYVFSRRSDYLREELLVILNLSPDPVAEYRIGVQNFDEAELILDSDSKHYGGSGYAEQIHSRLYCRKEPHYGFPCSILLPVPPLSAIYIKLKGVFTRCLKIK
jgi:1,4-alpha-glucan branching enzyme